MIDRNTRPTDALRGRPTTPPAGGQYREWQNRNGRYIPPSRNHTTVINNTTVVNNITVIQNNWRGGNSYGWYTIGGYNVCHRYYGGYHYWGWYIGDVYFWAPYYGGYWWWWDPYWHRHCWWYNGYWWYQDATVIYIYDSDRGVYNRYDDSAGGVVTVPDTTPPAETPPPADDPTPAPTNNEKVYNSGDGTRMVQVSDAQSTDDQGNTTTAKGRAYLYAADDDGADQALKDGIWLGDNVEEVRFQNKDDKLEKILTLFKDENGQESFNLFDRDGNNLNSPAVEPAPADPTPTPEGDQGTQDGTGSKFKSGTLRELQGLKTSGW